jgi:hypothetical protein
MAFWGTKNYLSMVLYFYFTSRQSINVLYMCQILLLKKLKLKKIKKLKKGERKEK